MEPNLSAAAVAIILRVVLERGQGVDQQKSVDVVFEFEEALFASRPKKKRLKDTRLSTDSRAVVTAKTYLTALRERTIKNKEKPNVIPKKPTLRVS